MEAAGDDDGGSPEIDISHECLVSFVGDFIEVCHFRADLFNLLEVQMMSIWIPAFAGMTKERKRFPLELTPRNLSPRKRGAGVGMTR